MKRTIRTYAANTKHLKVFLDGRHTNKPKCDPENYLQQKSNHYIKHKNMYKKHG